MWPGPSTQNGCCTPLPRRFSSLRHVLPPSQHICLITKTRFLAIHRLIPDIHRLIPTSSYTCLVIVPNKPHFALAVETHWNQVDTLETHQMILLLFPTCIENGDKMDKFSENLQMFIFTVFHLVFDESSPIIFKQIPVCRSKQDRTSSWATTQIVCSQTFGSLQIC